MRILYLCADHGIPVYGRRGCSTHVRETCCALRDAGHEVALLASQKGDDAQVHRDLEIIEARPPESRRIGYDLRNIWHNLAIYRAARALVRERRIEAVYERFSLYSVAGTWLGNRFRLPRIVEVNAFLSIEHEKKLHMLRLAQRAERYIVRNAPALTVVSRPLHDSLVEMGVNPARILTMPMAVDVGHFRFDRERGEAIRRRLNLMNRYVVGYIGGLAEWHGISMLYDMVARIQRERGNFVMLVVGGTESEVAAHRERAREAGLQEHLLFIGSVPYDEVPGYINTMDAALVPDTNYWTCPTKMFEYQASGIPTVAPRYPAIIEAIDHGVEGLLFAPRDIDGAVRCIMEIADDPERRALMGERTRQRVVASHSWEHNVANITRLFQRMHSGEFALRGPLAGAANAGEDAPPNAGMPAGAGVEAVNQGGES